MKRKQSIFFVLFFLALSLFMNGQTVDSVVAEQVGDLVKIRYRILNSTSDQLFKVTILCAINGGLKSELKNTFGDLGEVRGGKTEYTIVWDVLKDVDELQSADFFVRAEMIKEKETPVVIYQVETIPQAARKKDYPSHLLFIYVRHQESGGNCLGIRYGYMKKFGISVHSAFGLKIENNPFSFEVHPLMNSGVDFASRLFTKKKTQMYLLSGFAYAYGEGKTNDNPTLYKYSFFGGINIGSILDIGKFTSSLNIGIFPRYYNKKNIRPHFNSIELGIGFRF